MIKKINVQKFGVFDNYLWDSSIGRDFAFKKLNIIYGRNYSGKTTLSRIFRCIELSQLHNDYVDCNFSIKLDDGRDITHANLNTFQNKVRVYNSDFVRDNLSWLHNEDGTIRPFTILGATNVEIDKRIGEIDELIGSEENKTGLEFESSQKALDLKKQYDTVNSKRNAITQKLTDKAREIKNKASIYNVPTYQIRSILTDISSITPDFLLTDTVIENYNKLLKEDAKDVISRYKENRPGFNNFLTVVKELVEKKITPSKPIADLINDSLLQEWVRSGIILHKEGKTTCGFCGSSLPKELWNQLDAHFSKESEELRNDIQNQIEIIQKAKNSLSEYIRLRKDEFYSGFHDEWASTLEEWTSEIAVYSQNLDALVLKLEEREKDIFKSQELNDISDHSESIFNMLVKINVLIDKNNERTSSLASDQQSARQSLRLNDVARFVKDVDYYKLNEEVELLQQDYDRETPSLKELEKQIGDLLEEKRKLETEAKDESRGAELVNQHLSHFFGHDDLKLVAEGESPNMKFKINRFNENAKNLSEGECSLISFCYFIAKIQDELKEEANTNQVILYIDDPISSLDSNHVFFMFSLIDSVIAKPQKYNQLFISTHNLDFLKYLKKLTIPRERAQPDSALKQSVNHLIIERKSKTHSVLKNAPKYLKDYITEFNYLFEQMYKCAETNVEQMEHDYQYNFGNNARKFLEGYLYYKYPSHKLTNDNRLELFFNNETTVSLIRRVINEYSHLENQFDRALEPIDEDVIKKVALAIMNRIKETDPAQYDALVESIAA